MPILILLLALAFTACKSENNIKGKSSAVIGTLEERPFLIMPHGKNESKLRNILTETLIRKGMGEDKKLKTISQEEEFEFTAQSTVREQNDMASFQNGSRTQTRLLVSYSDHLIAYLVPLNMPVNTLMHELDIKTETDRKLVWISSKEGSTSTGQVIYLLSVNHEDLMEYDQHLSSVIVNGNAKTTSHDLTIRPGQKAELLFSTEYFLQGLQWQNFHGKNARCTSDLNEAGMCGACTYSRQTASAQFTSQTVTNLEELGLQVYVNGTAYAAETFLTDFKNGNQINLKMAVPVTAQQATNVKIVFSPKGKNINLNPTNIIGNCTADRNYSAVETLATKVTAALTVKIKGRGDVLKTIKL